MSATAIKSNPLPMAAPLDARPIAQRILEDSEASSQMGAQVDAQMQVELQQRELDRQAETKERQLDRVQEQQRLQQEAQVKQQQKEIELQQKQQESDARMETEKRKLELEAQKLEMQREKDRMQSAVTLATKTKPQVEASFDAGGLKEIGRRVAQVVSKARSLELQAQKAAGTAPNVSMKSTLSPQPGAAAATGPDVASIAKRHKLDPNMPRDQMARTIAQRRNSIGARAGNAYRDYTLSVRNAFGNVADAADNTLHGMANWDTPTSQLSLSDRVRQTRAQGGSIGSQAATGMAAGWDWLRSTVASPMASGARSIINTSDSVRDGFKAYDNKDLLGMADAAVGFGKNVGKQVVRTGMLPVTYGAGGWLGLGAAAGADALGLYGNNEGNGYFYSRYHADNPQAFANQTNEVLADMDRRKQVWQEYGGKPSATNPGRLPGGWQGYSAQTLNRMSPNSQFMRSYGNPMPMGQAGNMVYGLGQLFGLTPRVNMAYAGGNTQEATMTENMLNQLMASGYNFGR